MNSQTQQSPDFEQTQQALLQLGCLMDAAEAQGTLCGLLLDNSGVMTWLQSILPEMPDPGDVLAKEQLGILQQLHQSCREQLNHEDMAFDLLLPADAESLDVRLQMLVNWIQGYLFGYALTSKAKMDQVPLAVSECLDDLLQISQLDTAQTEDDENAEQQYMELLEYLRMGVLFLNESLNPVMSDQGQSGSLQ